MTVLGGQERGRAVRALYVGEFVSTLGIEMSSLAIAWSVLTNTDSAGKMALVMGVEIAPVGVVALVGGGLVASLGPRAVALVCEGSRAALFGVIALLLAQPHPSLLILLVLVALTGLMISPHLAAQRLLLAEIGGEDVTTMRRSSAGLQAATRGATLVGPLIAGSLVAALGPAPVIALDAVSYCLSFILIAAFVPRGLGASKGVSEGERGRVTRYLREDDVSRGLLSASAGSEFAFQALIAAVPVLALTRYGGGATTAGVLFACWGLGALCGNLLLTGARRVRSQLTLAAFASAGTALCFWGLSTLPPLPVAAAVLVSLGLGTGLRGPLVLSFCILRAPRDARAQVTTIFISLILCSAPVALVAAGPIIEFLSVRALLIVAALLMSACAARFAQIARHERPDLGNPPGPKRRRNIRAIFRPPLVPPQS